MPPCQRKGRVTWTSEKDENIQRLLERSKQLSGGCALRECKRMSGGECNKENNIYARLCYDEVCWVRVRVR